MEAIKQLEAKDIMATIANILTLIQQNYPKARMNLRTLLDIAVEIKKVTKHNIEEEGTPSFYVTQRVAQINSFIDTSALDESKDYQTAVTCFIHNTRYLDQLKILVHNLSDLKGLLIKIIYGVSLLEETEEIYQRCLALFALMHQGGEDAVNVIVESLGVESSMIHIEVCQISMHLMMILSLSHCSSSLDAFCFCFFLGCVCVRVEAKS